MIGLDDAISKGESEANALQIGPMTYIDLEPPGVFANHSCNPNAGLRNSTQNWALRDIQQGEEICFDYSTNMSERRWTMQCRCGQDSCRGVVTDFHELGKDLQEHYLALGVVQPFIVAEHQVLKSTAD